MTSCWLQRLENTLQHHRVSPSPALGRVPSRLRFLRITALLAAAALVGMNIYWGVSLVLQDSRRALPT